MTDTLFAYGSLRVGRIMHAVAGTAYLSQPATAKGYACYQVKGATYPGLIEKTDTETTGCIYQSITEASWKRLDEFEGILYIRQSISVTTQTGQKVSAQAYLIQPDKQHDLTSIIWDFDHFLSHNLDTFIKRNFGGHLPPERKSDPPAP